MTPRRGRATPRRWRRTPCSPSRPANCSKTAASDVDGDAVSYVLVAGASGLSFNADGTYSYTPAPNFNGSVSFTYKANDTLVDSNVATVTITVAPANDPPVAIDDT